jgi:hypothetical protein
MTHRQTVNIACLQTSNYILVENWGITKEYQNKDRFKDHGQYLYQMWNDYVIKLLNLNV